MEGFILKCNKCGLQYDLTLDNSYTAIKSYFHCGSSNIMDRMVVFCMRCGNKEEFGISWIPDLIERKVK